MAIALPDIETCTYARVPKPGRWTIDIDNPQIDTTGQTVTAYGRCPGQTQVTLGTTAGAGLGVDLQITADSDDLVEGIVYELFVTTPADTLVPNDTDGRFFIRVRDDSAA